MQNPIIIIGTGLAGYTTAKEIRKRDQSTPLLMITQDRGRYYSKPMLSTACAQNKTIDALTLSDADQMAANLSAEIHTQSVIKRIDIQNKKIIMDDAAFNFSKLILACGAKTNKLSIGGDAVSQVYSINDLTRYEDFHKKLSQSKKIVIIGAGLIGCEFANDLCSAGHAVTIISPDTHPMRRMLPKPIAEMLSHRLTAAGVNWIFNDAADEVNQQRNGFEVTLKSGERLDADIVISAIGIRSNTAIAEAAGIAVNHGVMTDEFLQTNKADIYALGDCAEIAGQVRQFVAPIMHASKALAATMCGESTAVQFPIMPVVVKTPDCPVVLVPPAHEMEGEWQYAMDADHAVAKFMNEQGSLSGFILLGKKAIAQRMALMQMM